MVVLGQNRLYSYKVLLFRQKWLYLGKSGCIRAKWLYSGKVYVFGQKWPNTTILAKKKPLLPEYIHFA